ncbi:NusB antitermination factor [Limimonas halophila]|uniref:Transcription antitermination protein NusB n=1 Tax=Limimonas halophila TaxID=1082479 RepID=A0A1G7NVH0_9PROT|nr:transcription antitermination factor NusB [Limimonas halophila]SDF78036.1 NusB antitermination factor [Limimonas halophila]
MSAASARPHAPDRRTQARLAAVQALYQVELGELDPGTVLLDFLQNRLHEDMEGLKIGRVDRTLFGQLVNGVPGRRRELDDMVCAVLDPDWPLDRLETVLRIILECGAYELSENQDAPVGAIINEYVELGRAFFDGGEAGLVNGVLDRLARTLHPETARGGDAAGDFA